MAVQTYCDREDIEAIIGKPSVLACIDDDEDGLENPEDEDKITSVIERAASEINGYIRHQYVLTDVTNNAWLKWANAQLASYLLRTRRNNPAEASHVDAIQEVRKLLVEVRWGRDQLPDQSPSFNHTATVSNFRIELGNPVSPVAVDTDQSTGPNPVGSRKRNIARQR